MDLSKIKKGLRLIKEGLFPFRKTCSYTKGWHRECVGCIADDRMVRGFTVILDQILTEIQISDIKEKNGLPRFIKERNDN